MLGLFTIESVNCHLETKGNCGNELASFLDQALLQQSLFFTDFEAILTNEPFTSLPYTFISYQKSLPDNIQVTFAEESLQYFLQTADGQKFAVGTEGSVVNLAKNESNLPEIQINKSAEDLLSSKKLSPEIHGAIAALLNSLHKQNLSFQDIKWHSTNEIEFFLTTGQKIILDAENPSQAIEKLKLILDSTEIEVIEKPIEAIDLRFEMPVLRTSE